ncbi:MAG: CD1247 N-terminal domain-containing protein [Butyricicoccus sp.]|nr:hypothetical protein [Clostridiales bacterium]
MTVTERVAYVRGLFEGLDFSAEKKEGRILQAMLDLLEDMALSIEDLEEENDALQDVIDTMVEDMYDDDDSYDELEDDDIELDPEADLFQVICPSCGEEIYIDESTLEMGSIGCPACGEDLEFDLSALEDDLPAYPGMDSDD